MKELKRRGAEYFENVLNRDTVSEKALEENEKVVDTVDVIEDVISED